MKAAVKVFRSDVERRVRVIVNKLYGSCRAGGWLAGAITIDKPPPGYRVSVEDVGVDEEKQSGFVFPPPPPIVGYDLVPHRRIDLSGCLPLTGQSRWMISSEEHLTRNLAGRPNEKECREKLAGIDLETHTLLGVSFFSGYCGEPKGLKLSVIRETQSDRRNYVVVKAVFTNTLNSCHKWTTYPVWLVVPQVTTGYLLKVDAKPLSRAHEPRVPPEQPVEWIEK